MLIETLIQIGLDKKEAKIYLACLTLGETSIKDIAIKSGIKRTTLYEITNKMIYAGYLKNTIKGKRKKIIAIDPKDLKKLLQKRETLLDEIMPELSQMSNNDSIKPKVWTFSGKDGLYKAYEDILNYPKNEVIGWASGEVVKLFGIKECKKYIQKRLRRKIMQTLIMPTEKETQTLIEENNKQLRRTKLIDSEVYPFKIEINVYVDKIAIFSAREKMAIILESKPIATAMRTIFRICWDGIETQKSL